MIFFLNLFEKKYFFNKSSWPLSRDLTIKACISNFNLVLSFKLVMLCTVGYCGVRYVLVLECDFVNKKVLSYQLCVLCSCIIPSKKLLKQRPNFCLVNKICWNKGLMSCAVSYDIRTVYIDYFYWLNLQQFCWDEQLSVNSLYLRWS